VGFDTERVHFQTGGGKIKRNETKAAHFVWGGVEIVRKREDPSPVFQIKKTRKKTPHNQGLREALNGGIASDGTPDFWDHPSSRVSKKKSKRKRYKRNKSKSQPKLGRGSCENIFCEKAGGEGQTRA